MKQNFSSKQFKRVFEMVVFMKYNPSVIADHLKIEQLLFDEMLIEARPQILEKLRKVDGIIIINGSNIILNSSNDNVSEPHQYDWLPDCWKDYVWDSAPRRIHCFFECTKRDHNCYCEVKTRAL